MKNFPTKESTSLNMKNTLSMSFSSARTTTTKGQMGWSWLNGF